MSKYYVEAQMRLADGDEKLVAFGQVIVNHAIKFRVQVRKCVDKDGNDSMFISFPRRKTNDEEKPYEDVTYPADDELLHEIQTVVFDTLRFDVWKEVMRPEIENVRVTPLQRGDSLKALATVTVCGMTIRGISVIDGKNGMFVKMPQYQDSKGEYHDHVYGISRSVQDAIAEEVLESYEKKLQYRQEDIGPRR